MGGAGGTAGLDGGGGANAGGDQAVADLAGEKPAADVNGDQAAGAADVAPAGDTAKEHAIGDCADLDGNGILDCVESLVSNPDFKKDGASWGAEFNSTMEWSPQNAEGGSTSGSLLVTNVALAASSAQSMVGARQCLPISGSSGYNIWANVFLLAALLTFRWVGITAT